MSGDVLREPELIRLCASALGRARRGCRSIPQPVSSSNILFHNAENAGLRIHSCACCFLCKKPCESKRAYRAADASPQTPVSASV